MRKEDENEDQGKISLSISAIISLMVGILNIKSRHYFNGSFMLIVFVLVSVEVFRKFKNAHIKK
ncbi:hypothetical protein LGL08_10360 [Clostridium estertheticum]|uniref:hypothetical protein n=1 Tax=Clostridium estertheticum TaxID=238834 RepID=UPI001CF27E1E|nr:hypothetical protein [Clostridium estertheticum]MCB2309128.1 hypothetical protein [Clostridium estertheticum]MCB2344880.1 hypothetical protein [Clostridium estertheticum]MCB2349954.1 hypothetical protein [Clostridium estertheticum]WAG48126.1 hypothetical protein LL127_22015 [Clostridium estertheticum]